MVKITHVMSDGTERDSLKGFEVSMNELTIDAYKVVVEVSERKMNSITKR